MTVGLPVEGAIDVVIKATESGIDGVEIINRRLLGVPERLAGFEAEEAVRRMAGLFSVCRAAQGATALFAVEDALGERADATHFTARKILTLAETALEHAHRMILGWSALLGAPPDVRTLKAARVALADMASDLYLDGDWLRIGGGRLHRSFGAAQDRLRAARAAFDQGGLLLSPDSDPAFLQGWLDEGRGVPANMLGWLLKNDLADYGRSDAAFLHSSNRRAIRDALFSNDPAFPARPTLSFAVCETGPLARRSGDRMVMDALSRHGRGLFARFLAATLDLAQTMAAAEAALAGLTPNERGGSTRSARPSSQTQTDGFALLEAARGLLAHRVSVQGSTIAHYRILAPTEWNFHPKGALFQGLLGNRRGQDPEFLAGLLVEALDPCVSCRIRVENHA